MRSCALEPPSLPLPLYPDISEKEIKIDQKSTFVCVESNSLRPWCLVPWCRSPFGCRAREARDHIFPEVSLFLASLPASDSGSHELRAWRFRRSLSASTGGALRCELSMSAICLTKWVRRRVSNVFAEPVTFYIIPKPIVKKASRSSIRRGSKSRFTQM